MTDPSTRTVLVLGGSGNVGEGIVTQLRAAGAVVVVPTRRPAEARELLGPDVQIVEGSVGTAADAAALRDAVDDRGITDVVASIGSWWSGDPVGALAPAEYDAVIASRLGAHFHAANTLLPVLARSAADSPSYTFINGGAAASPVAGSGLISVASAGQLMLGRVVAEEQAEGPVHVTTLVAATPVLTRDRPTGEAHWVTAQAIGDVCVAIVGGARLVPVVELTDDESTRTVIDSAGW